MTNLDTMTRPAWRCRRAISLVTLALVAILAFVACGGYGGGASASGSGAKSEEGGTAGDVGTTKIAGREANDHGSKDITGSDEAELELDDFYFEPTVLMGKAGQKVTIKMSNEGDSEHNFSIEDQGIDEDVEPGGKADVKVTFPESGKLLFFCKYHTGQGMNGGLQVS